MKSSILGISFPYTVKKFSEEDLPDILSLCQGNPTYYHHMKMTPTLENLRETLTALPQGKTIEDKYFVGFYQEKTLVALLDLIMGYPDANTAFIGWFMMNQSFQGTGRGTAIITELLSFLKKEGFRYVRLGYVKGNSESKGFWTKNQFLPTGVEYDTADYTVVVLQRAL